ncbi:MAG: hypothetical protein OEM41_03445 [Ignavibacteria bacterium]|nr:hypothetical protein [Ignavibacteria bacterium]
MKIVPVLTRALWVMTPALSLFFISCAGSMEFFREVDAQVTRGDYTGAVDAVRKNHDAYGDKSTVLYNLDMGLLLHYQGAADSSNAYFFAAEQKMQDLYTKSISLAALSTILNDNLLPYEGEDFEKVLVNMFLALNYAGKGEADDALVEARKVDVKLREFSRQYEEKNTYKEDAFIRYVAGVLYESRGEINDAFISYRKAYEIYQTYAVSYGTRAPSFLLDDIVRTATLMSFNDEADHYRSLGGRTFDRADRSLGSIVVLTYVGKGPIKQEVRPTVSVPDDKGILHTFQIALPKFVSRHTESRSYDVTVRGTDTTYRATTEVAENVTAIAAKTLDDRLGLIYLKSGGRALLKFLAAEKAKSEIGKNGKNEGGNVLASIAIDIAVGLTEQADVRTWRTLPAEFQLSRVWVPPGEYAVRIESSDGGYTMRDVPVTVLSGNNRFVIADDIR